MHARARAQMAHALILGLAVLMALVLAPAPAQAHGKAPVARDDALTVRAGKKAVERPLANDTLVHAGRARVRIVTAPGKLRAEVVDVTKIRFRPRDNVRGDYRVVYRVIDRHGRTDRAGVNVRVRPHAESLIVRTRRLPVATETRSGYARSKFRHWVDTNGDCQDTRSEVLRQESERAVTGGCTVLDGAWRSRYDGRTWYRASDVDVDHHVALAEAWDSGAKKWNAGTRERFANDLRDRRTLNAMTDNLNQSKSDRDPGEWMPPNQRCGYVTDWVAVKVRWGLMVDRAEKSTLESYATSCSHRIVRVSRARIVTGGTSDGGTTGGGDTSVSGGLRFVSIVYDPDGDERYAPNTERVVIKNVTAATVNLADIVLRDEVGRAFTMPSYSLGAGRSVSVHSGSGTNGGGHLYARWNTAVWNNSGDVATLLAGDGALIDRCAYAGGGTTASC